MTARTRINRANAQHSTGPNTPEGKQRSSLNALRHGLTGQIVVMPGEDLEAYQRRLASYTQAYRPVGPAEEDLVQALADTAWRLNRVAAMETNLLSLGATTSGADSIQDAFSIVAALESQSKALSNLSMHTQRLSRQFERTIKLLHELQKTRKEEEQRDLDNLLDIMEMQKDKGEIYDASKDGFVFSDQQIAVARQFRTRNHRHEEALHYWETAA